jgi:hypothetical protein
MTNGSVAAFPCTFRASSVCTQEQPQVAAAVYVKSDARFYRHNYKIRAVYLQFVQFIESQLNLCSVRGTFSLVNGTL